MHHCRRVGNAAVVTVSERRNVALAHVFYNLQQVGFYVELGRFTCGISSNCGASAVFSEGEIVSTLGLTSFTVGVCFKQFVGEDAVSPTTIIIEKSQCNCVIPEALYLLVLHLFHRCSSDYIFIHLGCRALVGISSVLDYFP